MLATCSLLCVLGLLTRGISRAIGQRSMRMSVFTAIGTRCLVGKPRL